MSERAPGSMGEIDTVDVATDLAWEALRAGLGLPFSHPMSWVLFDFVETVATMNMTAAGRALRAALVDEGELREAVARMRETSELAPEYAAVLTEQAAGPFAVLAREHRFA